MVQLRDYITRLHPLFFCGKSRLDICQSRRIETNRMDNDDAKHHGQQEIKERSRKYHCNSRPHGLIVKCLRIGFIFILPQHHAGTTEGQKLQ